MSIDYSLVCYTCKERGPMVGSASSFYGFKVWADSTISEWMGHGQAIGTHEGHDLRIVSELTELPWEGME